MPAHAIAVNLARLAQQIRAAATTVGRNESEIRLIAVSKTQPDEQIMRAYEYGQRDFGENRVQELEGKAQRLPSDCCWHLIGHLQRNKVRSAVRLAAWIHSVDSFELLSRIDRIAAEEGRRPHILIQVNISGEATKSGVAPDTATDLVRACLDCRQITCAGLMTMLPFGLDSTSMLGLFRELSSLRSEIEQRLNTALPELSMGMSADFEKAIEAGATMVRVGTALFGARG